MQIWPASLTLLPAGSANCQLFVTQGRIDQSAVGQSVDPLAKNCGNAGKKAEMFYFKEMFYFL